MIWFLTFALCIVAGGLRFIEGGSEKEFPWKVKIPSAMWRAGIGLSATTTAYIASSQIALASIAGISAAICISAGYTKFESYVWQFFRGLIPCLLTIGLLIWQGWQFSTLSALMMCLCYVSGYIVYSIGYHHLEGEWERYIRIFQGFSLCLSCAFV